MRSIMKYTLLCLVFSVLLFSDDTVLAQEGEPFVEIERTLNIGIRKHKKTGRETVLLKVFLRAWRSKARENEYTGSLSLDYVRNRLFCDNEPASILNGPKRVGDETEPVPMVFLLAIDVSGSMGGSGKLQNKYKRRMKQLEQALTGFVDRIEDNPSIFVRLYPWGHFVPYSVDLGGANQRLDQWEGKYLPLDAQGKAALRQGIRDIGLFVREGNRNVHTALYGVCLEGVQELKRVIAGEPDFHQAIPVLIVLTDGENDPQLAPYQYQAHKLAYVTSELSRFEPLIHVFTIGFGLDTQKAREDLKQISSVTSAWSREVADGTDAARRLESVYHELVEFEGNAWWVDIDTKKTNQQEGILPSKIYWKGDENGVNYRMLLVPSARVNLSPKTIGITLAVSGVFLLILVNVWYFTRPREIAEGEDGWREGIGDEEIEPVETRSGAVGVKKYMRQGNKDDDS